MRPINSKFRGFAKVYSIMLDSSVWDNELWTRMAWVVLLMKANADGSVRGTTHSLARDAGITREQAKEAITVLESPDAESANKEHEGRRLLPIDGGWQIVSHQKYREYRSAQQVKNAEYQAAHRARVSSISPANPQSESYLSADIPDNKNSPKFPKSLERSYLSADIASASESVSESIGFVGGSGGEGFECATLGGKSYPPPDFEPSAHLVRDLGQLGATNIPLLVEKYKTIAFKAHCEPQAARFKRFAIQEIQNAQGRPVAPNAPKQVPFAKPGDR